MKTIEELKAFDLNPRRISPQALEGLDSSLERFGDIAGIVYNQRLGCLVAGHQRVRVLQERGAAMEHDEAGPFLRDPTTGEVFRVRVVDWDEPTHKAACLAANSPAIAGEFTEDALQLLEDVRLELPETFDELRLEDLLSSLAGAFGEVDLGPPRVLTDDEIPEPPEEPITQPGDLWMLGDHRLLCGDCTKPEDVLRLMNGERAALFATDPPYLVDYDGTNHPKGNKDWSESYGITWDDASQGPELYEAFVQAAIDFALRPDAAWYCWHASRRQAMVEAVWAKFGAFVHQQIIWVKTRPVLVHSHYLWQHEPCFFGWVQGHRPPKVAEDYLSTVWQIAGLSGEDRPDHPTPKPLDCFGNPMRQHVQEGGLCYEPFAGSGSQIIAAEQLRRRCYALEIEPSYVDVAVARWCALTGREAVRESDGFVFPAVEREAA